MNGKGPSLLEMIGSVLSAAFGVSIDRNRQRDFSSGSPVKFAVLGVIGTVLFVFTVIQVVKLVLAQASG